MDDSRDQNSNLPLISFVIPTLNEEDRILRCLQSIRAADYPNEKKEIIVVDTGSTDRTLALVKSFPSITLITEKPTVSSAAYGLNIGIAHASGAYVQYVAADCVLDRQWIQTALQTFGKSGDEVAVVGGRSIEQTAGTSVFGRVLAIGLNFGSLSTGRVLFNPGSGLIKKTAIETVGSFRADMVSEDEVEFGIRVAEAGLHYLRLPEAMVYHHLDLHNSPSGFKKMVRRYWLLGTGIRQLQTVHRHSAVLRRYIASLSRYLVAYVGLLLFLAACVTAALHPSLWLLPLVFPVLWILYAVKVSRSAHFPLGDVLLLTLWYAFTSHFIVNGYCYTCVFKPTKYQAKG